MEMWLKMTIFSEADLARMRATQVAHMQDECVIRRCTTTPNSINEAVKTFTEDVTATICGLDMRSGDERHTVQFNTLIYDATIRIPIATVIDSKDQVKVTKRFGETLAAPLTFEIVGPVQPGPSGIRLKLKKVEL
jgi:hypothetical protein